MLRTLVLLLASAAGVAAAAEAGGAGSSEISSRVESLRQEFDLSVQAAPGAPLTAALLDDLRIGLEQLPRAARRSPGGALEVILHPEPMPFGLGDGSDSRPEWSEGRRRFHLYALAPEADARASRRLEQLAPEARESLWRRRAVIHAIVQRFDDARRWSDRPSWRRINGWLAPLDRPLTFRERVLNSYAGAFSRARGQVSASLDLVTFAEEALIPVKSILQSALPVDDRVRCQEFSKSRFLTAVLRELAPAAEAPSALVRGDCPLFAEWSSPATLSHLEVMFASPSGAHPESVFGHVSLRAVRHPGALASGPSFEPVMELAALTSPRESNYLVNGLSGGFSGIFSTSTMTHVLKENLEVDQRTVRRFRLNLSPADSLRVLERMWELERRGYLPYYFFTDNCAALLLFLLNGAFDDTREIPSPGVLWKLPTGALDAMGKVEIEEQLPSGELRRTPLLTHVPGDFESSRDIAERATRTRLAVLETLLPRLTTALAAQWRTQDEKRRSREPAIRREAHAALGLLVLPTLASHDLTTRGLVLDYVADTVRVERYAADLAVAAKAKVDLRAIQLPRDLVVPTSEELIAKRQELFERETPTARREVELHQATLVQELLKSAPRRPLDEEERRVVAHEAVTREALFAILEIQAQLGELAPDLDLAERNTADRDRFIEAQVEVDRRSVPASGAGRLGLGVSAVRGPAGLPVPGLSLRTAMLAEELGDQRQRGFGPMTQLRILDAEAQWRLQAGWPELLRSDFTLGSFRTLARPPLRTGLLDALGWGWDVAFGTRAGRPDPVRARALGELLVVLHESPRLENHTLLSIGLGADVRAQSWPSALGLTGRVGLSHRQHLFGAYLNAIRFDLSYLPFLIAAGSARGELRHQFRGTLGLRFQAGARLAIGPQLEAEWERASGGDDALASGGVAFEIL